jgi:hypothetical protein
MIEVKLHIPTTNSGQVKPKPNFYKADYVSINHYLSLIDWERILVPSDINQMYNKFLEILHTTIRLFVPINRVKQRPKLPKEIRQILNTKRRLYKKSKIDGSSKAAYKEQAKLYKLAIRNYRRKSEQKILESGSKKVLYNHIKKTLHNRHRIPPLEHNGRICLDSVSKANLLNNTFSEVFLKDQDPTLPNLHQTAPITTPSILTYISPQNISTAISHLKNSVSQTPDSVPSHYVRNTSSQLVIPLTILFNHSIRTGQIPELWKRAIVVPIYKKKGRMNDSKNYRPISLTSVICRLLERIIHNQIVSHLLNNEIISPAQHGFMRRRSTQTQQIKFMDKITSHYDQNKQLEIIYLDFSKAFDKVSHDKLVNLLKHIKLHHQLVSWIQHYLSGRSQVTTVESSYSECVPISSGVPQGSVLGPLMFIVYIQDLLTTITSECKDTTVYAFADDVKLLSTNPDDLQRALDIVNKWTKEWKLLLNTAKSEHLTLRLKVDQTFVIANQDIPKVNKVRDLGVMISDDVKWKTHIQKIRSKANILSHIILKTFLSDNTQLLVNLYKTYVRPIMEYNTCTWSPHYKEDIDSLEAVQGSFTRRVCQRGNISYTSYTDRLTKLNLESLQTRRIKNDLILLYKMMNNLVDIDYAHYFHIQDFAGHNLRRHRLHLGRAKPQNTLCRRNFFSIRVIPYWNELPESTVVSPSLSMFKHKLRQVTFDSQSNSA